MGGVAKKYITELKCEKTFLQGHILSMRLEMFTNFQCGWRCSQQHHQIANPILTCGCPNEFQVAWQLYIVQLLIF
jgi:hypothetical protein